MLTDARPSAGAFLVSLAYLLACACDLQREAGRRNRANSQLRTTALAHYPYGTNLDDPITLEPLGGGRFLFVAPTGGGVVGEVVRFVDEPGRPTRMYTGDSWIDRVT